MNRLEQLKEPRRNGARSPHAFCIDQDSDERELADALHSEGVLTLVRSNYIQTSTRNLNYKLYRINETK